LLFILYTNDIYQTLTTCSCILFADDTTVYCTSDNLDFLLQVVTRDMSILTDWFRANKLSLNLTKTNCVLFRPKGWTINRPFNLILGSEQLALTNSTKFLGLNIDENLSWTGHSKTVCNKVSSGLYMLDQVRDEVPPEQKRMLYMSLVNSHITYCLMVWGPMALAKDKDRLNKQQKRTVRAIENVERDAHTNPLFSKFKILKLDEMIDLELGKFMYKYVNKSLPLPLLELFESNQQVHAYNTRGQLNARSFEHRADCFVRSYLAKGPSSWSKLPNDLKSCTSIFSFSRKLKSLKIAEY